MDIITLQTSPHKHECFLFDFETGEVFIDEPHKTPHEAQKALTSGQGAALPCLYSNNSNEPNSNPPQNGHNKYSIQHKKSAIALANNVEYMSQTYGLDNLGFLTLTFPFKVTCMREAQKLFNNMSTAFLRELFPNSIWVKERHKNNSIHFHGVVNCQTNIRKGFDFKAIRNKDYSSASPELKKIWSKLRRNLPKYKFGRSELLPIKSTAEGIARYVGAYIKKGVTTRTENDKGIRLVNYGGDSRNTTTRMSIVSKGSAQWRYKVALFIKNLNRYRYGLPTITFNNIKTYLGKSWAYDYREAILNQPDKPLEIPI